MVSVLLTAVFYPFYYLYLWVLDLPIYFNYPLLLYFEARLGLYYFFLYPFLRHTYEKLKTGQDVSELVYGETPYSTLEVALSEIRTREGTLHPFTSFADIGCGKGKLVFYMALKYEVPSLGIDLIPTFIKQAQLLCPSYLPATFCCQHFKQIDFSKINLVYVASTCFSETTHLELIAALRNLPDKAYVISTSRGIADPAFHTIYSWMLPTGWGRSQLILQQKLSAS